MLFTIKPTPASIPRRRLDLLLNAPWYKHDKQKADTQLSELQQLKSSKELSEKGLKKRCCKRREKFNEEISGQS